MGIFYRVSHFLVPGLLSDGSSLHLLCDQISVNGLSKVTFIFMKRFCTHDKGLLDRKTCLTQYCNLTGLANSLFIVQRIGL